MHWLQRKKPQLSAKSHFLKKIKKKRIKHHFPKNAHLLRFFLIFSEMGLSRELRFFAL